MRDLDVFRAKIQAYLATLPESEQDSLDSLLAALEAQRRSRPRAHVGLSWTAPSMQQFKVRFGEFVETEGMGSLPIGPRRR